MKKTSIIYILLTAILLIGASACGRKQHVNVSPDSLYFNIQSSTANIYIEADCDWSITKEASADWLTLSTTSGSKDATVTVTVATNNTQHERSTFLTVSSANGKVKKNVIVQQNNTINLSHVSLRVWFLRFYERWDLDYYSQTIEESYRSFTYYVGPGTENNYFYFLEDGTGYQVYARKTMDTIVYQFDYTLYPNGDSLYINYWMADETLVEDYHVVIQELNADRFVFTNEYLHHQFEKLTLVDVSNFKGSLKINPKHIQPKTHGPMISIE